MTSHQPPSPYALNAKDVGRRPGTMVPVERTVEAPEAIGTDVIAIPAGSPVELDLRMESVVEGILVSGRATGQATGACVRCLTEVTEPVSVRVQELFAYADRAAHHQQVGDEQADEGYLIEGDEIDLEPVLVDAVVTSLPFQPVCQENCPGLCPQCGIALIDEPDHQHDVIDPRWSSLAELASPEATQRLKPTHEKRK